jgi:hypothetical protein
LLILLSLASGCSGDGGVRAADTVWRVIEAEVAGDALTLRNGVGREIVFQRGPG